MLVNTQSLANARDPRYDLCRSEFGGGDPNGKYSVRGVSVCVRVDMCVESVECSPGESGPHSVRAQPARAIFCHGFWLGFWLVFDQTTIRYQSDCDKMSIRSNGEGKGKKSADPSTPKLLITQRVALWINIFKYR